ncbi:MAG: hypothetical protein KC635_15995 [Myxococcales bacterium]|nr:hypothetical protein [Myxococcales bacterium]MCB9734911.1 hypothetical protein [Deltaproteobacteria bacterium]
MPLSRLIKRSAGVAACLVTLLSGAGAFADLPATVSFGDTPITDANINSTFDVIIVVDFGPGVYKNLALQVNWTGLSPQASASPVGREFEEADTLGSTGYRWLQYVTPPVSGDPNDDRRWLTVPEGAVAKRQFRITVSSARFADLDLAQRSFTVALSGDLAPAQTAAYVQDLIDNDELEMLDGLTYEADATIPNAVHTITMHGTTTFTWAGYENASGNLVGRFGQDGTTTGISRRFVFAPINKGTAKMGSPVDFDVTWGSGYQYVRAGVGIYAPTYNYGFTLDPDKVVLDTPAPTAWAAGAGSLSGTTVEDLQTATVGGNATGGTRQAMFVELFIPCSAFGKTQAESDAQQAQYAVSANAATEWVDADGTVEQPYSLTGPAIGATDLTKTCGEGAAMSLTHYYPAPVDPGYRFDWLTRITTPFGVSSYTRAMLAYPIPVDIVSVSNPSSSPLSGVWRCNFSTFPGSFTIDEFLGRRDSFCEPGLGAVGTASAAGHDTVVYYGENESVGLSLSGYLYTDYTYAYALAHPGETHVQTSFFVGETAVFGTFELSDSAVSPPIPSTGTVALQMGRDNNWNGSDAPETINLDANAGVGNLYVRMIANTGLYQYNPAFAVSWPDGVIIDEIYALEPATVTPATSPSAPYTSPAAWSAGSASEPYLLTGNVWGRVRFHVDPAYPWIDGQRINFSGVGAAEDGPDVTATTYYIANVATGMDFQISGGCWAEEAWAGWNADEAYVAPPNAQEGLLVYKATAINRGRDALTDMELRFVMPPASDATFVTAFAGADMPSAAVISYSYDHGASWTTSILSTDGITDVRATGIDIPGDGLDAPRPALYVGVLPTVSATTVTGSGWAYTDTFELGATQTKTAEVDATACRAACVCDERACQTYTCDAEGTCVYANVADNTLCAYEGSDLCVLSAGCRAGACVAAETVSCGDGDACTDVACDPATGQCASSPVVDCNANGLPFYLTVTNDVQRVQGAVVCYVQGGVLSCDAPGGTFALHTELRHSCGGLAHALPALPKAQ